MRAAAVDNTIELLTEASTLDQLMMLVRAGARHAVTADGATFVLREGDLVFYADEDAISPLWKGQRFPMTSCISGWAIAHDEPVAIPDITVDERIPQAAYKPTFVKSLAMVPIGRGAPVGAIGTYWAHEHHARADELRLLARLADATAEALERVGLDDAPYTPSSLKN